MAHTGRTDEGIDRLDAILEELQEEDSFQGVVVYTNTAKHLLHILVENDRLTKMIPVCEAMLKRVRELRDHPDRPVFRVGTPTSYLVLLSPIRHHHLA